MKLYKTLLHVWIALMSVLTFLGGWAMLAHSRKPVQPAAQSSASVNLAPLPTLPPIQAFGSGTSNNNAFVPQVAPVQQSSSFFPVMRTGGS
jgi:hypothetical protein